MNGTYIPPHPGRYLREDLEEFGIEPRTFAKRIGVELEDLLAVLEEKAPITQDLAERIAGNLEGPPRPCGSPCRRNSRRGRRRTVRTANLPTDRPSAFSKRKRLRFQS